MTKIKAENLCFAYDNGRQRVRALNGLDLEIGDGEFVCVIGASGCGKSTLLRILAGLETADSGTVSIDGEAIRGTGADRMIVFQDYALFPWLRARENVSFALRRACHSGKREAKAKAEDFLRMVGMGEAMELYPCQMSGGMRQRVAIARALAMDTDILLLDEPFGALDAKNRGELQALLLQLWQNAARKKTVVFVTHDLNEAILLGDSVVFMEKGRVREKVKICLPRPRDMEQFCPCRRRLMELFEEAQQNET